MSNPFDQFDGAGDQPRGVRNNNPLNLTGHWDGQIGSDGQFAQFASVEDGRAAADRNLQAYNTKHGINTVAGVVSRWAPPSENDTGAYIAKVSQDLGVAPDAPLPLGDPAVRSKLLGAMEAHETGQAPAAAANPFDQFDGAAAPAPRTGPAASLPSPPASAAPAVINAETGKPYNPAQQAAYAQLIQAGKLDPNAAPGSQAFPRGLASDKDQPKPGDWYVDIDGSVKQAPGLGKDIGLGFLSGGGKAGTGLVDTVLSASPMGQIPQMLATAADLAGGSAPQTAPFHGFSANADPALYKPQTTPGKYAEAVGEMLPNAVGPGGVVRKLASVVLPGLASQAAGDAAEGMGANPTTTQVARFLGGMAGGLGAGVGVTRGAAAPKALPLADVKASSDKAWAAVDASGYRFPQDRVQSAADDIKAIVDEAGPELYENSAKVASRVTQLADRGDLTPAQANRLRSQIGEKLLKPGSDEASVGRAIQDRINQLIDTGSGESTALADARTKYARYMKLKDVTDRLDDAGLNQAASGTGGNMNAARQALKPLVKNKSAQRMRNATPDEMAALKQVVNGTPAQNLLRAGSAFDPFHSRLGALIQGGLGIKTLGASAATVPLGMAATAGERALAQRNIDQLLAVLSTGQKATPAKLNLQAQPLAPFNLGILLGLMQPAPSPAQSPRR